MDCPLYIKMKIFYKVPLKGFNENLPIEFAKKIFLKESPFLQYLNDNKALRMRFRSWPDYQLESFISDCSNIEDLIGKIKQQESSGII